MLSAAESKSPKRGISIKNPLVNETQGKCYGPGDGFLMGKGLFCTKSRRKRFLFFSAYNLTPTRIVPKPFSSSPLKYCSFKKMSEGVAGLAKIMEWH
jgi:hypothetical protein